MKLDIGRLISASGLLAAVVLCAGNPCFAQNSDDVNLSLHANSHARAADIGLPIYPGATLFKNTDSKSNDSAADIGFTFGDFHFTIVAVSYATSDSPAQILDFYRKPLSRYGEVLECNHGKPVGTLATTKTGLRCSDEHGGHVQVNGSANSSSDHELRAGSAHKYRIVGIDESRPGRTRFGLVYLELPKEKKAE
jgi:hypothetical protein